MSNFNPLGAKLWKCAEDDHRVLRSRRRYTRVDQSLLFELVFIWVYVFAVLIRRPFQTRITICIHLFRLGKKKTHKGKEEEALSSSLSRCLSDFTNKLSLKSEDENNGDKANNSVP